MAIPTESFDAILANYSAAIEWMTNLGIKLGPGRASHYEKIVRYWRDSYKTASVDEAKSIFPDFVSSIFEIHDFVDIHRAFESLSADRLSSLVPKLQKGVNGPINTADETLESTAARNFLFEVAVAAHDGSVHRGALQCLGARLHAKTQKDNWNHRSLRVYVEFGSQKSSGSHHAVGDESTSECLSK